ncbi:hypothetical protein [Haloglomus halophilum]|uniref:hypothetical protein n=1 Tax=Haloglomus halophilum TaxID=2962672 RepID=UPI0020C9C26C|nr:hypothetical protein [Haloglomus halophilum]
MPAGELRRVADPTDTEAVRAAFIGTYGTASETADAATLVAQYERVREHCAEHPNQGSAAVASALDLPRPRIRTWVDNDGRPDAVRGLDRLTERGWLHLGWDDPTLRALAGLIVWTVVGGSLPRQGWTPAFSVADGTEPDIERLGDVLGLEWRQRHVDDDISGAEWVPARDGSVLGRLLAVLGAPTGADEGPSLPPWLLLDAPRAVRLDAARVAVRQRGTALDLPTMPLQLGLHRDGRREAIARLCRSVAPSDGEVRVDDGGNIRLDRRAAELLAAAPLLDGFLPR